MPLQLQDVVITGSAKKGIVCVPGGTDQIAGRSGNAKIRDGDDLLFGEGGIDALEGDVGADWIVGGGDTGFIFGGSNSHAIDPASNEGLGPVADEVESGSGTDTATADTFGMVAADREVAIRVSPIRRAAWRRMP